MAIEHAKKTGKVLVELPEIQFDDSVLDAAVLSYVLNYTLVVLSPGLSIVVTDHNSFKPLKVLRLNENGIKMSNVR